MGSDSGYKIGSLLTTPEARTVSPRLITFTGRRSKPLNHRARDGEMLIDGWIKIENKREREACVFHLVYRLYGTLWLRLMD